MIEEYAITPDVFDSSEYTNKALIEAFLPFFMDILLKDSLLRDTFDGGFSHYCIAHSATLHKRCGEFLRKMQTRNQLRVFPRQSTTQPASANDWCNEALLASAASKLDGIVVSNNLKSKFPMAEVASIEKLAASPWWKSRSCSATIRRRTDDYIRLLDRILAQANSLMFIDPNLDPSRPNYNSFYRVLTAAAGRTRKPTIEIHRSICDGDGSARTIPSESDWKLNFSGLSKQLSSSGLSAEVFFWTDFHDRFLITDIAGILVPAGFDESRNQAEPPTTWGRMGKKDRDEVQRRYDPAVNPASLKFKFKIGI